MNKVSWLWRPEMGVYEWHEKYRGVSLRMSPPDEWGVRTVGGVQWPGTIQFHFHIAHDADQMPGLLPRLRREVDLRMPPKEEPHAVEQPVS